MTHAQTPSGGRRARRSAASRAQAQAPSRTGTDSVRRFPALVVTGVLVAAVCVAGLLLDRRAPAAVGRPPVEPIDLAPVAPDPDALGSTWYCAGGTGSEGGAAHAVHIANPGDEPVDVVLTVMPGDVRGQAVTSVPVTERQEVPAGGRLDVALTEILDAPFISAVVEAGAGELVVEHSVDGGSDFGTAPCASSSSSTWHLAAGATTRDATEQLVLFNPFPDDAVVDVTFSTPDGVRSPPAFSGFIVPGRGVVAVDVGSVVSRHANVSATVVARTGRLVVDRLQRFDSSNGPGGLALGGAAPATAEVWHFPDGLAASGLSEVVTVYNPTDRQAEVDVEVVLDPSTDPAAPPAADPFQLSIPPQQFAQVVVAEDGRVPVGRGHSLTVRSQNGVPVVAERWVRAGLPTSLSGFAATLGSPVLATRWLAAIGSTADEQTEFLVLRNPATDAIARVRITAPSGDDDGALAGLEALEIPPAGRVVIDLRDYVTRDGLALVVESTLPIVAERGLYRSGGLAQSVLVPTAGTASVASVDTGAAAVAPQPTVTTAPTSTSTSTSTSTTTTIASTTTAAPTAPVPPP